MTTRAYLRISVATAESGALDKQRAEVLAAERTAGRDPEAVEFYTDRGVSGGKAVDERPALSRLLADLRAGDVLVATKVDRLARSVINLNQIADAVKATGAELVFTGDPIDTTSPSGGLMLNILGALAQFEREMVRERVSATRKRFLSTGRHMGRVPFGFAVVPNPFGDGTVVRPHPENGPQLREGIARVMRGESQASVAESLGQDKASFSRLLNNPRLYGATPVKGGVLLDNGAPVIDPDAALLSVAEFRELRAYLSKPEKTWSKSDRFGIALACSECTEHLFFNRNAKNENWGAYRCKARAHEKGTPAVSIAANATDAEVESQFLALFGDTPYRVVTVTEDDSERTEAIAVAHVRIDEVSRLLAETNDPERIAALAADLAAAHNDRARAEAIPTEKRETVTDTGQTIGDVWRAAEGAERARLVAALGRFVVLPRSAGTHPEQRLMWLGLTPDAVATDGLPVSVSLLATDRGAMPLADA